MKMALRDPAWIENLAVWRRVTDSKLPATMARKHSESKYRIEAEK